jgi:hypothetical protein
MKNIRKFPRENCSETTFFTTRTMVFEGLIKNISREGVYIRSFLALPVGQTITIALPSSRNKNRDIKIEGKVVWINEDGFGVKFHEQMPALPHH